MKHIYKISIVLLSVFTFIGCNVDDDEAVSIIPEKSLTATLVDQRAVIAVPDDTSSYDLVINFSEALPSYATIEYSIDGSVTSASKNTGDTSLTIPITFGLGENFHDVVISDFIVVNASERNFLPSILGNTTVRVIKQGFFVANITWGDASDDIDFGLQPMTAGWADTFAWIDTSLGVTNAEFLEGSELPDGNYAIFVQFFTGAADVTVTYAIQCAGGDFTFDLLTTQDGNRLWFTKSTDGDGNVSYNFFTEDPA